MKCGKLLENPKCTAACKSSMRSASSGTGKSVITSCDTSYISYGRDMDRYYLTDANGVTRHFLQKAMYHCAQEESASKSWINPAEKFAVPSRTRVRSAC